MSPLDDRFVRFSLRFAVVAGLLALGGCATFPHQPPTLYCDIEGECVGYEPRAVPAYYPYGFAPYGYSGFGYAPYGYSSFGYGSSLVIGGGVGAWRSRPFIYRAPPPAFRAHGFAGGGFGPGPRHFGPRGPGGFRGGPGFRGGGRGGRR